MKRIAIVIMALAGLARADVGTCLNIGDGTPCVAPCVAYGVCAHQQCQPIIISADGASCASGNRCIIDDTCANGVCVAGSTPIVCPDKNGCEVGICDAQIGCTTQNICPDLALPPDFSSAPPDLGGDLASLPDLTSPVDQASVDQASVDQASAPDFATADLSLPPAVDPAFSVRGSNVAGCDVTQTSPHGSFLFIFMALLVAIRVRHVQRY